MIFLSAQPDDYYFTWQLELQIYNFNKLGIAAENIHILIGYNPRTGLPGHFRELIEENKSKACFFTYPDTRVQKEYAPSIRPHIIHKHLSTYPEIEKETIFYHDADIIFRQLPDFELLQKGDTWYVSDTKSYTDSVYIKQNAGEKTFKAMCDLVGIDPLRVCDADTDCGGAQYLLKKTTKSFWEKVERDCEALYILLEDHNHFQAELFFKKFGLLQSDYIGVQSWCTDMWVVYWNALMLKKEVKIHPELDFIIAKDPVEKWEIVKILHYSGEEINALGPVFRKINYIHFKPYFDQSLESVDYSKTASFYIVKLIKEYRDKLNENRIDLTDVTFLIPVRIDSESRLNNLYIATACLNKHFITKILVAESDSETRIDKTRLPSCCECLFIEDDNNFLHRTHVNNILIRKAESDVIAIFDSDVVFPVNQVLESVLSIRHGNADMVSPYSGEFISISNLYKTMMAKVLDPELLVLNKEKFHVATCRSYGGAAFLHRKKYMASGMENEHFTSWGPEDIERPKRMANLGYKVKRVNGPLFHLPHERNLNSGYPDVNYYVKFMEEYLRISDMDAETLGSYISTWDWNYSNQ